MISKTGSQKKNTFSIYLHMEDFPVYELRLISRNCEVETTVGYFFQCQDRGIKGLHYRIVTHTAIHSPMQKGHVLLVKEVPIEWNREPPVRRKRENVSSMHPLGV